VSLSLQQRLHLVAEGSAACQHIEFLEALCRDIQQTILLPSVPHHRAMDERIERLLAADGVTEIRRAG
jgi:hypothetical protein